MSYRFKVGDLVMCRTGQDDWSPGSVVKLDYQEPDMPKPAPYQVELYDGALIYVPLDIPDLCKEMSLAWWEALIHEASADAPPLEEFESQLRAGKDPNELTALDDTLLLAVLRAKWVPAAASALKAGADPNKGSVTFVRPLTAAVRCSPEAVELLLRFKADPNLQEKDPTQSHDRKSVTYEPREWHRAPLHYAALRCRESCAMLLDAKADVGMLDGQYKQPLHLALESGKLEIAELILSRGADADAGNAMIGLSTTPLQEAAYKGDVAAVELLLRCKADVNRVGKLGNTALHLASRGQHAEVAEKLLAASADVTVRNAAGKTAAELAAANGMRELAAKLGGEGAGVQPGGASAWRGPLEAAEGLFADAKLFDALQKANTAAELLALELGLEASQLLKEPDAVVSASQERASPEQREALLRLSVCRGGIFDGLGAVQQAQQSYAVGELLAPDDAELKAKRARLEKDAPELMQGDKVPCSIITGFLGSGKTTLLNHILRENHGKRIAVIENEFGEVGIDDALVKGNNQAQEEDIVEMNNGCICCTVRGDLIRGLRSLFKKTTGNGRPLDGVLIETTGLADPAPVAQTFFADDFVQQHMVLDGILTLVDAKHIVEHLDEEKPEGVENEAVEQIAFADRILLNKCDLADEAHLAEVERRIRTINAVVPIKRTVNSVIDMSFILGIRAFSLERVLAREEEFLADDQDHQHDNRVSSVGIDVPGEVDEDVLKRWLGRLLSDKGVDLFRSKGVLAVKGRSQKLVFQAIHMLSGMSYQGAWQPMERRICRFVFIGKNLDREELTQGFKACLAQK